MNGSRVWTEPEVRAMARAMCDEMLYEHLKVPTVLAYYLMKLYSNNNVVVIPAEEMANAEKVNYAFEIGEMKDGRVFVLLHKLPSDELPPPLSPEEIMQLVTEHDRRD